MDDRKNFDENEEEKYYGPIEGQMCYDELLLPEEPEEKKEEPPVVLEGQMDIWSIKPQNNNRPEKQNKKEKFEEKTKPNEDKNAGNEKAEDFGEDDFAESEEKQEEKIEEIENNDSLDKNELENESFESDGIIETDENDETFDNDESEEDVSSEDFDEDDSDVYEEENEDTSEILNNIKTYNDTTYKVPKINNKVKFSGNDDLDDLENEDLDEEIEDDEEFEKLGNEEIGRESMEDKKEIQNNANGFYGDGGSGIITKELSEVLHDSMIPYTEHVVMDRALPRVEDGLKPVQRRILYSMMELGLTPDKPYRKSARIVGDCMGKYHPHGDLSVYDAMVRLSQDFVLRAPLVDGHGNFGSVDGDSAAAMRYTEARMTPLALELLRDLEKNTVKWSLNFDDTLKEPDVLPGRFPNLLVNGASGIAVGVATNIPPHNLGEVIDGVVAYINNPNITLAQMMKIIKGPDFPTGGELIFGDGLKSAYETGKGKITIRAKVGIEQNGDKQSLVITELPYQVNKALLLQKIAELKEKNRDKLADISEIRDESDRSGMRAVIRLKKDANAKKILGILFQNTNMQISYAINMVAIAGGKPRQMGLMDIISYYTAFQRDVIVRRTKYDLDLAKDRAHIVEGLLIAIKNIDAVIKIIKTSPNVTEAKSRLRAKFALSEKQAQAILDMRLARLVNLEVNKLQAELKDLKQKIKEYEAILASKKLQLEVVKTEILEIKRKFNNPRRSHEGKEGGEIVLKKMEEVEDTKDYLLLLSAGKTIKKVNMTNYVKTSKTVGDGSTLFDIITSKMKVKATDNVLIVTEKGNAVKVNVAQIPECKWKDKGTTLKNIDKNVDIMESPVAILPFTSVDILLMTEQGIVKRMSGQDAVITKSYYQIMKVADDDKLISAEVEEKGKSILMFTKHGFVVNFEKSEVPTQGRVSGGVKGVNLEDKDSVVFAGQNVYDSVIVITDNGYVKRLSAIQIPMCARYRKGVKYINLTGNGKGVKFVGGKDKAVIDLGLKFKLIEMKKLKTSADRLASGTQEVKQKVLGAYAFED